MKTMNVMKAMKAREPMKAIKKTVHRQIVPEMPQCKPKSSGKRMKAMKVMKTTKSMNGKGGTVLAKHKGTIVQDVSPITSWSKTWSSVGEEGWRLVKLVWEGDTVTEHWQQF